MIRKYLRVMVLSGVICLLGVTSALAVKYNEAPTLRTKVATGELPPIEERLPEEPVIVPVVEEIGQYGGTWHRAWLGPADVWGPRKIVWEPLVSFSADGTKIIPNVAKSYEISEKGKVYTFYLRKGMKWSDGEPFTADDVLFKFEDEFSNEELTPSFPIWLTIEGKPVKLEKVGDYTVRFRFAKPNGMFLIQFVTAMGHNFYAPKHYLRQFHPRYTPMDKIEKLVKEEGFDYWYQLYGSKAFWATNPDHPTLSAWKASTPPTAIRFIMERNPYYWKVDPEGNQLPYIDRIVNDRMEDWGMVNFKATTGEIDMQMRGIKLDNYTLFMENREKGNYRILKWVNAIGADPVIQPNLNAKDLILRKLIQDDRFRKALSLAINREEMNELIHMGLGEPRQASLISGAPYYSEEWEKVYAEYAPERANALLDKIGLKWDKDHKYRLRPDGKILSLTIDMSVTEGPWVDSCQLIKEYWEVIGIKTVLKTQDRSLFSLRCLANEHEVNIWGMDRHFPFLAEPMRLIPIFVLADTWGIEYARWYATKGKAGQEPTGDIAKLQELWDKIKVAIDEKERDQLVQEIVKLHIKNIWTIGTVGELPTLVIVKNNFRNVPEKIVNDNNVRSPNNAVPAQFFIKQK